MSQQPDSLQNRRDKLKKSAYTLVAVWLGFIGIVFAWFTGSAQAQIGPLTLSASWTGVAMTSYKQIDAADTYAEIAMATAIEDCTYEKIDEEIGTFALEGAVPGSVIYFKTVISNKTKDEVTISLYLSNIRYSEVLDTYIQFVPIASKASDETETRELTGKSILQNGTPVEDGYLRSSLRLAEGIRVPGNGGSVGKTTVYWCIKIDENVGSEGENAWLTIEQLYMKDESSSES